MRTLDFFSKNINKSKDNKDRDKKERERGDHPPSQNRFINTYQLATNRGTRKIKKLTIFQVFTTTMRTSSVPVPSICKSSSSFLVHQLLLLFTLFAFPTTTFALKAEWIPIPTSHKLSPRRSGHTAFSAAAAVASDNHKGSTIYVFGGYIEEDNKNNKKGSGFIGK